MGSAIFRDVTNLEVGELGGSRYACRSAGDEVKVGNAVVVQVESKPARFYAGVGGRIDNLCSGELGAGEKSDARSACRRGIGPEVLFQFRAESRLGSLITGSLIAIECFAGFGTCHMRRFLDEVVQLVVMFSGNLRARRRGRRADSIVSSTEKGVKRGF